MTSLDLARDVAAEFDFPFDSVEWFAERGNINLDAFDVRGPGGRTLLQRISPAVFTQPGRVVRNMLLVTEAQRAAAIEDDERWEVPSLVARSDGAYTVERDGTWRLIAFIEGSVSYKRLAGLAREDQLRTARECGRGLAMWLDRTAHVDPASLRSSLPGYRDARVYLGQWDCAVAGERECPELPDDEEIRSSCAAHYAVALSPEEYAARRNDPEIEAAVAFVAAHRGLLTEIADGRASGRIADRAIHGDTKIENFLFDAETGAAIALVDLDTIMPHSWLVDWGDMVRSLCNVAGETERDLDLIRVDKEIYSEVTRGFLSEIRSATPEEIALMPRAVASIALELGIRFLADYLRGDTYFQLGLTDATDLNRVRGLGQLRLAAHLIDRLDAVATTTPTHGV